MATKPAPSAWATGAKLTAPALNAGDYDVWNFLDKTKPVCVLTQNTVQTGIVTATFTAITFDAEVLDTDAQHSTASNTSRVVIGNTLGWYRCSGGIAWGGTAGTYTFRAELDLNGTGINGSQLILPSTGTFGSAFLPPTFVQATAAADYVEMKGYQNSGANMSTAVSGTFRSLFVVEYVGTLQ